jgi:hypothetical protein
MNTDYQEIMDKTGVYEIKDHLYAMKAGYKCSRLSNSLRENVAELKWNRNAEAQMLVGELLEAIDENETIASTDKIDHLLHMVLADKIINRTPNTFKELWSSENEDY